MRAISKEVCQSRVTGSLNGRVTPLDHGHLFCTQTIQLCSPSSRSRKRSAHVMREMNLVMSVTSLTSSRALSDSRGGIFLLIAPNRETPDGARRKLTGDEERSGK
jgi:hypothetical protein